MAVQYHTSKRGKRSVSIGTLDFKFNSTDGYFVETSYNRALAMESPDIIDVFKDITEYGKKQFEDYFRKLSETKSSQTEDTSTDSPSVCED